MKMSGSAGLFNNFLFFLYLVGSPKVGGAGDGKHKKKYGHPYMYMYIYDLEKPPTHLTSKWKGTIQYFQFHDKMPYIYYLEKPPPI